MRSVRGWLPITVIALALTVPAAAQTTGGEGWGLRIGVADDPDQFIIGGQYDFGAFADQWHFEPNVELGFGDDHTIIAGTAAAHYHFTRIDRFRPYAGGGVTVGWVDRELPPPSSGDDSDIEIGLKAAGGFRWPVSNGDQLFVELNINFGDLQDLEVLFGWQF